MNECPRHPGKNSMVVCMKCGRYFCRLCSPPRGDVLLCPSCYQERVDEIKKRMPEAPPPAKEAKVSSVTKRLRKPRQATRIAPSPTPPVSPSKKPLKTPRAATVPLREQQEGVGEISPTPVPTPRAAPKHKPPARAFDALKSGFSSVLAFFSRVIEAIKPSGISERISLHNEMRARARHERIALRETERLLRREKRARALRSLGAGASLASSAFSPAVVP